MMDRAAAAPLFSWQGNVFDVALEHDEQGRLYRDRVIVVAPRRNGKTYEVIALVLWLCGKHRRNVIYTAHQYDTAKEMYNSFVEFVADRPHMYKKLIQHVSRTNGAERILFRNGAQFSIRARTKSGGRGRETDTLICDEGLELTADQMSALTPLLAKSQAEGFGQIWILSSAGHGESEVLAELRDKGRAAVADGSDPRLAYFEFAAPRGISLDDRTWWAAANPSLGTQVLSEDFLARQRALLDDEAFGREHLGWWTDEVTEPWLPDGLWAHCLTPVVPARRQSGRITLGFEVSVHGTSAVVAVDLDHGLWVEQVLAWEPTAEPSRIAAEIADWSTRHGVTVVAADGLTGDIVLQRLAALGITTSRLSAGQITAATGHLVAEAAAGRISHNGDARLGEQVAAAGTVPALDGMRRLSRKRSTGPCQGAFALAAAVWSAAAPIPARPVITTLDGVS
jgi:phage terminase large subunit-like protein